MDNPQKRAVARIEIEIVDLNDNAPEFEVDVYNISIVENLPSGFSVLQVQAIDRDQGENAEFTYQISEESPSGAFVVDARSGWITVRDQELLDRERRTSITMSIQAVEREAAYAQRADGAGVVLVEVTLLDSNDNTPAFEMGNLYEFRVNVDAAVGTVVGVVRATDPDEGRNGMVFYELQHPRGSGAVPFRLDQESGELRVAGALRRGRLAVFVEASDQPVNPSERRFSLAVVTVEIYAARMNEAVDFVGAPYEFWVGADVPIGASVGQIRTNYDDGGGGGGIMFDLLHSYTEGVPFAVEERSGIVTVIRQLEQFERREYEFEAVAAQADQLRADVELRKRSFVRGGAGARAASKTSRLVATDAEAEMFELDEGTISDSENVLVTNVTIHVVGVDDERGILRRGTYDDPIEFHVKENQAGVLIGQLLYMNYSTTDPDGAERRRAFTATADVAPTTALTAAPARRDLFSARSDQSRSNAPLSRAGRLPYSRSMRNASTASAAITPAALVMPAPTTLATPTRADFGQRRNRNTDSQTSFYVAITPNVYFEAGNAADGMLDFDLPELLRVQRAEPLIRRRRFKPKSKIIASDGKKNAANEVHDGRLAEGQWSKTSAITSITTTTMEPPPTQPLDNSEPEIEVHITPRSIAAQRRNAKQHTNLIVVKPPANETHRRALSPSERQSPRPYLRFVIANQPDVAEQIAITDDGTLKTVGALDREMRSIYRLTVLAEYSRGSVSGAGIYQVIVHVDDVNDNAPEFGRRAYAGIIAENSALGSEVYLNQAIWVRDADTDENANFTVRLAGDDSHMFAVVEGGDVDDDEQDVHRLSAADDRITKLQSYFPNLPQFFVDRSAAGFDAETSPSFGGNNFAGSSLNRSRYTLRFVGPATLDRERTAFYALRIIATDTGGLSSEVRLDVSVADVNDNAPSIERIAVLRTSGVRIVDASNYINTYYVQKLVGFEDGGDAEGAPMVLNDNHAADETDGTNAYDETDETLHIAMASTLPAAKHHPHNIVGTPRLLHHSGADRLDRLTAGMAMHSFAMPENVTLARGLLQITAIDDDLAENARITYRIAVERLVASRSTANEKFTTAARHVEDTSALTGHHFAINPMTGELQLLRRPPAETHIYVNVSASDVGGLVDHVLLKFVVEDVNDHAPVFERPWYTFDLTEGEYKDGNETAAIIGTIRASDADFGANANLTYSIVAGSSSTSAGQDDGNSTSTSATATSVTALPFRIDARTAVLSVTGELDRELVQRYEFRVRATDGGRPHTLSATTEIEINVLDVNDNAPEFMGFDDMVLTVNPLVPGLEVRAHLPVFKVYLQRNTEPGTVVREIRAIDRDFAGNGNGLVMYALMQPPRWPAFFQIDSREGTVTTTQRFHRHRNYEHFNVTVVATDLGSPSMVAAAVMLVNVQGWEDGDASAEASVEASSESGSSETLLERDDGDAAVADSDYEDDRLFVNRYFEVEVEENSIVPMELVRLNVSARYRDDPFKWSIVATADEEPIYEPFYLDPRNGSVWLTRALDREQRDEYSMRVRAERVLRDGRNMMMQATMVYPIRGERVRDLRENEVRVVIRVLDTNDNAPRFSGNGRPIISVIPSAANFGFPVTNVHASDADIGVNADIRYALLNEPLGLFGIDARSGHIRVLRSIAAAAAEAEAEAAAMRQLTVGSDHSAVGQSVAALAAATAASLASGTDTSMPGVQRVYGFDVKATDRAGASDGRSAIANVFVYVLDESRQVRLVVAGRPEEVEKRIDGLMRTLSDVTELDVRVRILEPHAAQSDVRSPA